MKFIALIAGLLIFGCASHLPSDVYLDLETPEVTASVYTDIAATMHSRDLRTRPELIYFNLKKPAAVQTANSLPPDRLIAEKLSAALSRQGLTIRDDSPVALYLEVARLKVVVSKAKALYRADAAVDIQFIVDNRGKRLTKHYTRQKNQDSLTRPDVMTLERMLRDQLDEILALILSDQEIASLISREP